MCDKKFELLTDPVTGVVKATCSGFWSLDEAKVYLDQLANGINKARLRRRVVRVLVDNRTASVQTFVAIEEIGKTIIRVYEPFDRLAIIVGSQLLKRQMDRLSQVAITRVLTSLDDANDWLLSSDPA